jgi:hypothetical protein
MKNKVLNNLIIKGSPILGSSYPKISRQETNEILSILFEQLLLFDEIIINTDKDNFALFFLIKNLGIKTVERLIKSGYIKFEVNKSLIFVFEGNSLKTKEEREKEVIGKPPLVSGGLVKDDFDPEKNVEKALQQFNIHRGYKRLLLKEISLSYVNIDENELSSNAINIIIDSYKNNLLESFGLPYCKEENLLTIEERMKLAQIGSKVMSAMNLLNNGYKSMNSYDEFEILKNGYQNIGDALKISEATSEIFKIHNIPNLKELYLSNKYNIDDIFRLRHLENAKVYREWINNFNSELDTKQFTEDYFLEATNSKSYWESNKGKLFKELGVFGISMSAGTLIGGLAGSLIGLPIGIVTGYFIDSIVKSRNPKIYIDNLKKDLK